VILNGLCPRTVHDCSSTAIVNRSRFHSCGPVVSTSVAQFTKMCRPVGCRPVGLSPTCLSPRWCVAQMTGDRLLWSGSFTQAVSQHLNSSCTICCLHSGTAIIYVTVATAMNFRSFEVIRTKSHLLFKHRIWLYYYYYYYYYY